jgi:hypothetical protein
MIAPLSPPLSQAPASWTDWVRVARAGLDPEEFSRQSLRAGFVTSAAETGASILKIQEVSRHKSVDVLAAYVRRVDLFKDHAGAAFL